MNIQFLAYRDTKAQRFFERGKLCASVSLCAKLLLVTIAFFFTSCDDESDDFPRTEVRFSCSLQQAPYSLITAPGQFLTVNKKGAAYVVEHPGQPAYTDGKQGVILGFGGLILGQPVLSMDVSSQYAAYDRACPVEAADLTISRLTINTQREATCPKCGTVYDLDTGFPKKGSGKRRLKTYTVFVTNTATGKGLTVRD